MPKVTLRKNGEVYGTWFGEIAQFDTLITEQPEDLLTFDTLMAKQPEDLLSFALLCETGDPERPGKIRDWLLPGWIFDIDFRWDAEDRVVEIVTNVLAPKRRN